MIVIALGSNLPSDAGPPEATIAAAIEELRHRDIGVVAVSPMYATPAWPDPNDPPFVNAVARFGDRTVADGPAHERALHNVEASVWTGPGASQRSAHARYRFAGLQRSHSGTKSHTAAPADGDARICTRAALRHRARLAAPDFGQNRWQSLIADLSQEQRKVRGCFPCRRARPMRGCLNARSVAHCRLGCIVHGLDHERIRALYRSASYRRAPHPAQRSRRRASVSMVSEGCGYFRPSAAGPW